MRQGTSEYYRVSQYSRFSPIGVLRPKIAWLLSDTDSHRAKMYCQAFAISVSNTELLLVSQLRPAATAQRLCSAFFRVLLAAASAAGAAGGSGDTGCRCCCAYKIQPEMKRQTFSGSLPLFNQPGVD